MMSIQSYYEAKCGIRYKKRPFYRSELRELSNAIFKILNLLFLLHPFIWSSRFNAIDLVGSASRYTLFIGLWSRV